jgi:hypothetical protein
MPPDIVIRPSGVWDSRAPFHTYLSFHRRILRSYNVLCLAVERLKRDAKDPTVAAQSGRTWLRAKDGSFQAGLSWQNYRRTFPRLDAATRPSPKAAEIVGHLEEAFDGLKEQALVAFASTFETFPQTWALNTLLAKLEQGVGWGRTERRLAESFSVEHNTGEDLPSLPRILQAMPEIEEGLRNVPAFVTSDESNSEQAAPLTSEFNALKAIRCWRALRNLLVHRGGILNGRFLRRHGDFFEALQTHYPYMPTLQVGGRMPFFDAVVRSVGIVHYRAALWMSDRLEAVSGGGRGHPFAPSPKPQTFLFKGKVPPAPPLLVVGDHAASYLWVSDQNFRTNFRETLRVRV